MGTNDPGATVTGPGLDPVLVTSPSGRPPPARPHLAKPVLAGYDLVRAIGSGGMGVVWEAVEHRFDRRVALKVHAQVLATEGERDQLWAEAFVAARIGDPGIVRVLDVGTTLDDRPYYAMELVDGSDLATILADGPLAPRQAVGIAADVARAAAAAHEHGVIHRDLKPRNVIIDATGRARVLDFGIAFDVKAGVDLFAGQLAGSPAYMAPEQILGKRITPRTDVFAIGVMLYEMLTGSRPFVAPTTDELFVMIASRQPAAPSSRNPEVHEDLDGVVARCLQKESDDRYPSARALFETLSAIAEGRPIEPFSVGRTPTYAPKARAQPAPERPRREDAKKHMAWSWRLRSSPEALWPFVANTDRFNRAVGLAPATFSDEPQPDGGSLRTGEHKVLGMQLRWREYPFEWVKNRSHSVFRWYQTGPVAAVWNGVTLTPTPDGGTELHHDVWITPRGVIGQVASFMEMSKLGPAVDRFYRHLDQVLLAGAHDDPFEGPHVATAQQRAAVDAICARLHQDGFSSAIVEKLAMHLLTAPDERIGALRPYELADAWGFGREEILDVLMHASHLGLLDATWDVVCPKCMLAHESVPELAQVTRVGTCKACASSFERDLKGSVELVFAPSVAIRRLERTTYCVGSPALRPHVIAQQVLDPGEERVISVYLRRGTYRVAGSIAQTSSELVASAVGFVETVEVVAAGDRTNARPGIVKAGAVNVVLRNDSPFEETLRIEIPGARTDGVSAAKAMTHPTFRSLFSDQLLAHGEHLRVSQLAFVFVELSGRAKLFEQLGDAATCAELSHVDEAVREEARLHEGTVVPSSLDLLVIAFPTALVAFHTALALRERLDSAPLTANVAVAVHEGRCIALTRDGKPEFFGETLHRGHALLGDCPEGGLVLSASVAADRAGHRRDARLRAHRERAAVAERSVRRSSRDDAHAARRRY